MGKDAPQPQQVDYGETLAEQYAAQEAFAPDAYNIYQTYSPAYAATDVNNLYRTLFGGEEQVYTPDAVLRWEQPDGTAASKGRIDAIRQTLGDGYDSAVAGNSVEVDGQTWTATEYQPDDVIIPANEGLLSKYESDIQPVIDRLQNESASRQRAQEISDIQSLAPQAYDAIRDYNPDQTALADKLYSYAMDDLEAGRSLTDGEYREVEQAVRAGQGFRGMGFGPADVYAEAMSVGQAGEDRYRDRLAFGSQVLGQQQALYGDPWMQILGRGSGQAPLAFSAVNQGYGINSAAGPKNFTPESQNAFDIAGYNANALNATNIANANSSNALLGAGIGAIGSIGGDALGGWLGRP